MSTTEAASSWAPGMRATPSNYNEITPAQILPAQLGDRKTLRPEITFGKVTDVTHPLFSTYGKEFDSELAQIPVFRYWTIKPSPQPIEGARPLLNFADGAPALIERAFKGPKPGRVLLWTTPLSTSPYHNDPDVWNDFPNTKFWSFPVLMNLTVPYMAGTSTERLNYEAGETVLLRWTRAPTSPASRSRARTGRPRMSRRHRATSSWRSHRPRSRASGTSRRWPNDKSTSAMGFSINPPHDESKFTVLEKPDLDTIFGKDGYVLAEDAQALKHEEGVAIRLRGVPLADVLDPDRGDLGEFPGQYLL